MDLSLIQGLFVQNPRAGVWNWPWCCFKVGACSQKTGEALLRCLWTEAAVHIYFDLTRCPSICLCANLQEHRQFPDSRSLTGSCLSSGRSGSGSESNLDLQAGLNLMQILLPEIQANWLLFQTEARQSEFDLLHFCWLVRYSGCFVEMTKLVVAVPKGSLVHT